MNTLKLLALSLAVATSTIAAQNATVAGVSDSLDKVSLRELVNQAKAAVASNPDLAALFATIGDVNALSDAELAKLVKQILAVSNDGSGSGFGSNKLNNTAGGNSTTNAPAPAASTATPVVGPKGGAASLALAPAAVVALVVSVAYTLL